MFYAARGLGTATTNIPCCSGAPAQAGNCAAEAHSALIIARLFNSNFTLAKAAARNPPNRSLLSAAACGGFDKIRSTDDHFCPTLEKGRRAMRPA